MPEVLLRMLRSGLQNILWARGSAWLSQQENAKEHTTDNRGVVGSNPTGPTNSHVVETTVSLASNDLVSVSTEPVTTNLVRLDTSAKVTKSDELMTSTKLESILNSTPPRYDPATKPSCSIVR